MPSDVTNVKCVMLLMQTYGVSSAGGYIIFLIGEKNKYCPIEWKSNTC